MTKHISPLAVWISEYQATQPEATAHECWLQLVDIATHFPLALEWLLGYDAQRKEIVYRRSSAKPEQRLAKASVKRQFLRVRQVK